MSDIVGPSDRTESALFGFPLEAVLKMPDGRTIRVDDLFIEDRVGLLELDLEAVVGRIQEWQATAPAEVLAVSRA